MRRAYEIPLGVCMAIALCGCGASAPQPVHRSAAGRRAPQGYGYCLPLHPTRDHLPRIIVSASLTPSRPIQIQLKSRIDNAHHATFFMLPELLYTGRNAGTFWGIANWSMTKCLSTFVSPLGTAILNRGLFSWSGHFTKSLHFGTLVIVFDQHQYYITALAWH